MQNGNIYKFNAKDFLNSTALKVEKKPTFSEIGLLRISKEWGFNPLEPWKLELIINEDFGEGSVFIRVMGNVVTVFVAAASEQNG